MQLAASMATPDCPVLYVSGEESVQQLKMRADRLGMSTGHLFLVTETDLDVIIGHINEISPRLVVVDSIQTMYLAELTSAAGSISQVRECAARMQNLAKSSGVAVMLVGHVTKSGALAGPKVLEHIVDTVLYLEGDRFHTYRLLRERQEPLWRDERGGRVRDARAMAWSRSPIPPRHSWPNDWPLRRAARLR